MQPVNLPIGVFSRAEQRVLQAIFTEIADGGRCTSTLERLAHEAGTSRSTARNAIARAVAVGLLEKIERRSPNSVSLPNVLRIADDGMGVVAGSAARRGQAVHEARGTQH
jgi:DNA-binding FadR family transcriptional regulator